MNKNTYLFIIFSLGILFLGFFIGSFFWNKISFPFKNPLEVVGPLTLQKFNHTTNLIRYFIFVTLPSFIFLLFYSNSPVFRKLFFKDILEDQNNILFSCPFLKKDLLSREIKRYFFLLSFVIVVSFSLSGWIAFLSKDLLPSKLDMFHEGERLTPAYNYLKTGLLWKGSYFIHGVLQDPLITFLGWKFFGLNTIGASRIADDFMYCLIPLSLSILLFLLPIAVTETKKWWYKIILTQLLLAVFLYTSTNRFMFQYLAPRDSFVLVGFTFLVLAFGFKKSIFFLYNRSFFSSHICL